MIHSVEIKVGDYHNSSFEFFKGFFFYFRLGTLSK